MVDIFSASGFFVHTPCGPRKSGMPESVEMPAPVSTTTRFASSIQLRTVSIIGAMVTRIRSGGPAARRSLGGRRDGAGRDPACHRPNLSGRRAPDAHGGEQAARDREPPGEGVAAGVIVEGARDPGSDAAAADGR